jgi:hypothetical protein
MGCQPKTGVNKLSFTDQAMNDGPLSIVIRNREQCFCIVSSSAMLTKSYTLVLSFSAYSF